MKSLRVYVIGILGLLGMAVFPGSVSAAGKSVQAQLPWRPAHVVIVIEENKSFSTIIGNPDAPYLNQLAKEGALFTDAHAVRHPSEPNYLALFAGTTEGLTDDSCPHDYTGPNLASELLARKLTFAIYSEDLPQTGFTGCSGSGGLYRRKHNPVVDFQATNVPASLNRSFSDFPEDYSRLPTVAFVVPNMMNDMHDGTIAEGDVWLKTHLSRYAEWAKTHNSLLVITWDESDARSPTNQIPLIIVGAGVKPDRNGQYVDHYGVLRKLGNFYRLKPLGYSAETQSAALIRDPMDQHTRRFSLSIPESI
ncbi:MAG: alkaline phosphatase family protein [Gammaproteobacteria bacterium]